MIGAIYVAVISWGKPEDAGQSIRIVIPALVLCLYWTLAIVFNMRTTVVTPDRIRVRVRPFPTRPGHTIERGDIWHLYVRQHHDRGEDGDILETFYIVGVETTDREQIDLRPYKGSDRAVSRARDIAAVLNSVPDRSPIVIRPPSGDSSKTRRQRAWRVLIWGGAFILAILLGGAWEIANTPGYVRYTGPGASR